MIVEIQKQNKTTYDMSDMPPHSVGTMVDSQGNNIVVIFLPDAITGTFPVIGFGLDKPNDFRHWPDKRVHKHQVTPLPAGSKIILTV